MTTPTTDYFHALIHLGVSEPLARAAADELAKKKPYLLAATGKLLAGKDTITPGVLARLGATNVYHLSFATALKDELDQVFDAIRSSSSLDEAKDAIIALGVSPDKAMRMLEIGYEKARANLNLNSRSRTDWIRTALQVWGTDVRRETDKDYWVKRTVERAAEALAQGRNIMVTDVRFPNEVIACQAIGFTVVRLEISPEEQARRLWERDNLVPNPESQRAESETALDVYDGFDLVIDNNGSIEEGIQKVLYYIRTRVLSPVV